MYFLVFHRKLFHFLPALIARPSSAMQFRLDLSKIPLLAQLGRCYCKTSNLSSSKLAAAATEAIVSSCLRVDRQIYLCITFVKTMVEKNKAWDYLKWSSLNSCIAPSSTDCVFKIYQVLIAS